MLPTFLIVGAEKAGTTTLASMLSEHPEIHMCVPKEPRFFSGHNWDRGIPWYESLFHGAERCAAIGEASPAYSWAPQYKDAPKRIHTCLGDIKYVYIVREPIARMVSHYRHALLYRWLPDGTAFNQALRLRPDIIDCSRYLYQIEQYLPYTDASQWHVVVLEELSSRPHDVQRQLYRFLGVDEDFIAPVRAENRLDNKGRPPWISLEVARPFQRLLPAFLANAAKQVMYKTGKKIRSPVIPHEVLAELTQAFKPQIEGLSNFCGKDLNSLWARRAAAHTQEPTSPAWPNRSEPPRAQVP